jgi:hypothetical protein
MQITVEEQKKIKLPAKNFGYFNSTNKKTLSLKKRLEKLVADFKEIAIPEHGKFVNENY